jgi:hypothetical protein
MGEDLINGLIRMQKPDESELNAFRQDYDRARTTVKSQILKLEANTKKAGKSKGTPQMLQQVNNSKFRLLTNSPFNN